MKRCAQDQTPPPGNFDLQNPPPQCSIHLPAKLSAVSDTARPSWTAKSCLTLRKSTAVEQQPSLLQKIDYFQLASCFIALITCDTSMTPG